jgi:hypothetical protein
MAYVEHSIQAQKSCINFLKTFKGIIIIFSSQYCMLQCFVAAGIKYKVLGISARLSQAPSLNLLMHQHKEEPAPNLVT